MDFSDFEKVYGFLVKVEEEEAVAFKRTLSFKNN